MVECKTMYPKISLIWINHNSMDKKEVIAESIKSIQKLNYPDFELIAVDDGSTDGSSGFVHGLLQKSKIKWKFFRQETNRGLHSCLNIAYSMMDKKSKYFMILNNDAKLYPNALKGLVEGLEKDDKVGAAMGIELYWNSRVVANAGIMFDELLYGNTLCQGLNVNECEKKAHLISAASTALGIFRTKAFKKFGKKIAYEDMVRHFNETFFGARLWNIGYKVMYYPIIVGEHYRAVSEQSRSSKRFYYKLKGWMTLLLISNSQYKDSVTKDLFLLKNLFGHIKHDPRNFREYASLYRKISHDSQQKAKELRKKKVVIDIYKMPHIKGFRYFWISSASLTERWQPNLRFRDLLKAKSVYLPRT